MLSIFFLFVLLGKNNDQVIIWRKKGNQTNEQNYILGSVSLNTYAIFNNKITYTLQYRWYNRQKVSL